RTAKGAPGRRTSELIRGAQENSLTARAKGSQPSAAPALLLCQGGARFQCVEDDADEESFVAAECFAAALAFAAFAFEVGARVGVVAGLRDRDPVERGVELPVAAAVEPVAVCAAGARFQWGDAAGPGELGVASEAAGRADLGEQLRRGDGGAAGQLEQRRRHLERALLQLLVELCDRTIECPNRRNERTSKAHL